MTHVTSWKANKRMPTRNISMWMWTEARDALARAEQLHRRFFELASSARTPVWEPPADVLETRDGLLITMALPGVPAHAVEAAFDGDALVVVCERTLPPETQRAAIHRMEIPYGRFERRLTLPMGRYVLVEQDMENGCLVIRLRKLR
jgi:HSP20 family molecular chaperone IbpA